MTIAFICNATSIAIVGHVSFSWPSFTLLISLAYSLKLGVQSAEKHSIIF